MQLVGDDGAPEDHLSARPWNDGIVPGSRGQMVLAPSAAPVVAPYDIGGTTTTADSASATTTPVPPSFTSAPRAPGGAAAPLPRRYRNDLSVMTNPPEPFFDDEGLRSSFEMRSPATGVPIDPLYKAPPTLSTTPKSPRGSTSVVSSERLSPAASSRSTSLYTTSLGSPKSPVASKDTLANMINSLSNSTSPAHGAGVPFFPSGDPRGRVVGDPTHGAVLRASPRAGSPALSAHGGLTTSNHYAGGADRGLVSLSDGGGDSHQHSSMRDSIRSDPLRSGLAFERGTFSFRDMLSGAPPAPANAMDDDLDDLDNLNPLDESDDRLNKFSVDVAPESKSDNFRASIGATSVAGGCHHSGFGTGAFLTSAASPSDDGDIGHAPFGGNRRNMTTDFSGEFEFSRVNTQTSDEDPVLALSPTLPRKNRLLRDTPDSGPLRTAISGDDPLDSLLGLNRVEKLSPDEKRTASAVVHSPDVIHDEDDEDVGYSFDEFEQDVPEQDVDTTNGPPTSGVELDAMRAAPDELVSSTTQTKGRAGVGARAPLFVLNHGPPPASSSPSPPGEGVLKPIPASVFALYSAPPSLDAEIRADRHLRAHDREIPWILDWKVGKEGLAGVLACVQAQLLREGATSNEHSANSADFQLRRTIATMLRQIACGSASGSIYWCCEGDKYAEFDADDWDGPDDKITVERLILSAILTYGVKKLAAELGKACLATGNAVAPALLNLLMGGEPVGRT